MDSILPMGVGLPTFQRRLSRLYNDTKKSSDFVKEPVQNHAEADPEIKSLHRKLRIQKDRLVSWGLEWSDPNQSAEVLIDSSLSKAGLSEVVGSIMSTIKDILDEAEPLWHSSRRLAGERVEADQPPRRGEKIQLVVWDKSRFEDLVRDLTTSIDTLCDLSRTRSSYAQPSSAARAAVSKASTSTEDLRPFESSRIQTPQQISPTTLTNLRAIQAVPMTELADRERAREVVFMQRQAFTDLMQGLGGQHPHAPLLLEYATFDPIFSEVGIAPPMDRFEKLSTGLQTEPQRSSASWTGLPRLLGYFEDMDNSRFGLVYQFPKTFNPVTFEHLTQNPLYNLCSLADLLARPDFEPKLEAKFRLAANLANTIFDMHARGITHGNLVDENVSFCNAVGTDPEVSGISQGEVDIRRPLVSSFDLFSDPNIQSTQKPPSLYKHPLDPRNSAQSPLISQADSKTFDLYSLAMILLSVGLWTKLENLVPNANSPIPESVLEQLAIRCGSLYMKAVQACWNAVDQEMIGSHSADQIVSRAQFKASRYLEACCILDGVSNLEERLGDDLGEARPAARLSTASASSVAGPSKEKEAASEKLAQNIEAEAVSEAESRSAGKRASVQTPVQETETTSARPSVKMRLYPHVALSPDIVERWNTVLMPQINSALRHFYRKNPESVEISLESIGESPQKTKPTVLVVCTSVSKVRSILKQKLGAFFDSSVGLKVCSGQVFRSRKELRSMAAIAEGAPEIVAANPSHQERPQNGASIGAWIGDRHLPPVSFGGLIVVDDKPYGMTVHHMLDDPEQDQHTATTRENVPRSMAPPGLPDLNAWYAEQYQTGDSDFDSSSSSSGFACEFSDTDSDTSESAITSDQSDDDDDSDDEYAEDGDIPGIEPGCGDGYIVTQPALDDAPEGSFLVPETQNIDHLNRFSLGKMYASSGIRRRELDNLVHEIDWALFEFQDERQPDTNTIPNPATPGSVLPTAIAPTASFPGLEVQCMARTSGLQTGRILQTITSVKMKGRTSPSHSYQVSGTPNTPGNLPMGVPGDSGAWIVARSSGLVCGHVLAWSERKRVAYVCPMEVLLLDIIETLEAEEIRLPSGEVLVTGGTQKRARESMVSGGSFRRSGRWGSGEDEESCGEKPERRGSRRSKATDPGKRESRDYNDDDDDGDDDDSYDEGVEIELAHDLKRLQMTEAGRRDMERWGVR